MFGARLFTLTALAVLSSLSAVQAHGWPWSLSSRQESCRNCTAAEAWPGCKGDYKYFCDGSQYEPQSVEALHDAMHNDLGYGLCNGGGSRFPGLNKQAAGFWPPADVEDGEDVVITWKYTAKHPAANYTYWVTKADWDSSKSEPLTKDDFELYQVEDGHAGDMVYNTPVTHTLKGSHLAEHSGYNVILTEWWVGDTPNSFYGCIDINVKKSSSEKLAKKPAHATVAKSSVAATIKDKVQKALGTFDFNVKCEIMP